MRATPKVSGGGASFSRRFSPRTWPPGGPSPPTAPSITADSPLHPDCGPKNLLEEDEERFYAAQSLTPTITLTFPEAVTFDCWQLEEVIELGHRVRRFEVEVCADAQWHTLARGNASASGAVSGRSR